MNLFQKCIVFLLTILLFQLAVVSALGISLARAEESADKAAYSGRAIASCQHLTQNFFVASHCLLMLVATNAPGTSERFDDLCDGLEQEVSQLQTEKHASAQDKQELEQIGQIVSYLVDEMREVRGSMGKNKTPSDIFNMVKFIRFEVNPHLKDLHELVTKFAARHKNYEKAVAGDRQLRNLLRISVFSGFFLNILTTAAIVIGFSKGINARIGLIADNITRYGNKLSLHPRQSGHDEISLLDEKFHDLSRALDEAMAKDQAVFSNLPVALITCSSSNSIERMNPCAQTWLGHSEEEAINLPLSQITATQQDLQTAIDTAEKRLPSPSRIKCKRKDGSLFPAELSCSKFAHDGRMHTLMALVDVSDREKVDKLRQEFVSIVSHDIRAPMTSLKIFLGLLNDGQLGELTSKGKQQLSVAKTETARLIRLTADLLDIARLESGHVQLNKTLCELDVVMVQSLDAVKAYADEKNVELVCEPSNQHIHADQDRIVQILVNLLTNAIKFSAVGQQVSMTTTVVDDTVRISVTDHGRGIPESELPFLFDRFRQARTEDYSKGTGLGLSICKLLAEAHGGTVGVTSVDSKGSTFWLSLPLPKEAKAEERSAV